MILGGDTVNDEAVADTNPQDARAETGKKAIVEPSAETKASPRSVERQARHEHGADLFIWHHGGISGWLRIAVAMGLSSGPPVVDRQDTSGFGGASDRQPAKRLVLEQGAYVSLAWHCVESDDPSVEIGGVEKASEPVADTAVIDMEGSAIGQRAAPKIRFVVGQKGLRHATEGSEQPRSATAGEVPATTSENWLGESTLTPARPPRIG